MNKARFVESAPTYYALAIATYFIDHSWASSSREEIESFYTVNEHKDNEYQYLDIPILFEVAIQWLVAQNMIEELPDDFGPPIYSATPTATDAWRVLSERVDTPFHKFLRLQDGRPSWLRRALINVNEKFTELGMSVSDFESREPPDIEWEPIPLDRGEPELQSAIAAVDETIESVRGDNGYAAAVPEERKYVLATLTGASKRLKEDPEISISWLKKTIGEPLMLIIKRFGSSALGVVASVAKEALKEWLKKKGITFLDSL